MKFNRGEYFGAPEWLLETGKWKADVEWNIWLCLPIGFSAGAHSIRKLGAFAEWSWCLEVNPPLGEPNRLYLHAGYWWAILGLPSLRSERITQDKFVKRYLTWPHIHGCSRYKYHRGEDGKWVRNEHPEPMHWGWLTIWRDDR